MSFLLLQRHRSEGGPGGVSDRRAGAASTVNRQGTNTLEGVRKDTEMANNQGGNQGGGDKRGFASMDDEKQREIASQGGKAAHEKGTAHEFNSQEAREAGQKGGEAVSQDREHMAEIGRKGGEASGGGRSNTGNSGGGSSSGGSSN